MHPLLLKFYDLLIKVPNDAIQAGCEAVSVNARDQTGSFGTVSFFCEYGPDDPLFLNKLVAAGTNMKDTLELDSAWVRLSPLHLAAQKEKPRLLRALLDLGFPVNICHKFGDTACDVTASWNCKKLLLDAGGKTSTHHLIENVSKFLDTRDNRRAASIAILGLKRCQSTVSASKDVLSMIARCVWSTRGHEN